ncbi:hypothetical protein [Methanobrevibacter sp.]|nr:hypothetical protein [uncultured Methanobrevibacter sp.]
MVLKNEYCLRLLLKLEELPLAIEEILLAVTYFAMASYYLLLGINLLMH